MGVSRNNSFGKKIDIRDRIAAIQQSEDGGSPIRRPTRRGDGLSEIIEKVEDILASEHSEVYQQTAVNSQAITEFEKVLDRVLIAYEPKLTRVQQVEIKARILAKNTGAGALEMFMGEDSDDITEIMVNGPTGIFVERRGILETIDPDVLSLTADEVENIGRRLVNRNNRKWNDEIPIQKARLKDGSRVTLVGKPVAVYGPYINIRRFMSKSRSVEQLIEWNSISREWAEFLGECVRAGMNILVAGATGTGKSTFLDALLAENLPEGQRVLVIEENHELHIQDYHLNTVVLQANKNSDDEKGVTMRDCLKAALVMRPDRIIVAETKGSEAVEMVQAMLSGHRGSITTAHTKDSRWGSLKRMTEMLRQGQPGVPWEVLEGQVRDALDLIIYLERSEFDGVRRVTEITEVMPSYVEGEVFNTVGQFNEDTGVFEPIKPLTELRQAEINRLRKREQEFGRRTGSGGTH